MSANQIFAAAVDALHERPEAFKHALDDFVPHCDKIEMAAKHIYTQNMGLIELIDFLRGEFGGNYQTMQEQIQAVR